jgi:hypothetical protein
MLGDNGDGTNRRNADKSCGESRKVEAEKAEILVI